MKWVNVISACLAAAFLALVFYGAHQWYFRKPMPVVQNTYQNYTIAGNMTQENKEEAVKQSKVLTGIYGNNKEIGGLVGWLW